MNSSSPWNRPGWLDRVQIWINSQLLKLGYKITSPVRQSHVRPWSTVLDVPTDRGTLFFKASGDDPPFEPSITEAISSWFPENMPEVLAADHEQGWMLLKDGGTTLREVIRSDHDLGHWERLLPICTG